jgi:putative spermidine/putrescine transport system ATP-binding protein
MNYSPAPGGTMSIALRNCGKSFGAVRALEPVDLDIPAGQTMVLLGPSGCGKTTLLRLIAGLDFPDPGGQILFGGRDVTTQPIEHRRVGMVFQNYALFPNMTVAQNVAYGLRVRGVPRAVREAQTRKMLDLVRIADLADRRVDQLSGGQRQRVAIARAVAPSPSILLLDEPLTALDAKLRESLRTELDALLRGLRITSVYVTHDQAEAMALADRIVVMNKGRIEQVGTARDIYFRSATAFVANFIGTMNTVTVPASGGALHFPHGDLPWRGPSGMLAISFRPQDVILAAEHCHLRGAVIATFFLGDRLRVVIRPPGMPDITIELSNDHEIHAGMDLGVLLQPARIYNLA